MDKSTSLELKGLAILFMLFLHLFNTEERVNECITFLYLWNGKPLVLALSRIAAFCVPIYIFIGGYGYGTIHIDNKLNIRNNLKRVIKLYINYWIIFFPFIMLGSVFRPDYYPQNVTAFFQNLCGYSCSYNKEWWFLFPYIVIILLSPLLFRLITYKDENEGYRVGGKTLSLFLFIYIISEALSKCISLEISNSLLLFQIFNILKLSFVFVWAAAFAINGWIKDLSIWIRQHHINSGLSLTAICIIRMCLGPSFLNMFFVLLCIPLYLNINRLPIVKKILKFFGKHSTNMWLCHTFFAYYIWHDWIYGLQYPPLIYLALITLSLSVSFCATPVIRWLVRPFSNQHREFRKSQNNT